MEYRLCEAKTAGRLERAVNQLLGSGWRPLGGVSVTQSKNTTIWWYYQAMVRDQDPARLAWHRPGESAKPPSSGFGDFD